MGGEARPGVWVGFPFPGRMCAKKPGHVCAGEAGRVGWVEDLEGVRADFAADTRAADARAAEHHPPRPYLRRRRRRHSPPSRAGAWIRCGGCAGPA